MPKLVSKFVNELTSGSSMKLDERTTIPLFAVLTSLPLLVGGILWLTNIDAKASQALTGFEKQEVQTGEQSKLLHEVRDSVIRIEERLKKRGN